MPEKELVTTLRIPLTMISYESVSRMREFESIADLVVVGIEKGRVCTP
jgi:hypothetical protein